VISLSGWFNCSSSCSAIPKFDLEFTNSNQIVNCWIWISFLTFQSIYIQQNNVFSKREKHYYSKIKLYRSTYVWMSEGKVLRFKHRHFFPLPQILFFKLVVKKSIQQNYIFYNFFDKQKLIVCQLHQKPM
jgi:hypothetical protein